MEIKEKSVRFVANGTVYGTFWDDGEGYYPSRKLEGSSLEEIKKLAEDGLDGTLDSGMGFKDLLGALLNVTRIECVEIDGKDFYHKEYETLIIGDLTDDQYDFLMGLE